MKKNLPFVITMSIFAIACAAITMFTVKREPQYVRVVPNISGADVSEENIENIGAANKININTANSEELQTLSGIGEVTAGKIIAYREEHGGFLYIEELMEVSGIGEKMFAGLKDFIVAE